LISLQEVLSPGLIYALLWGLFAGLLAFLGRWLGGGPPPARPVDDPAPPDDAPAWRPLALGLAATSTTAAALLLAAARFADSVSPAVGLVVLAVLLILSLHLLRRGLPR
jgi:hypothetical protein